MSDDNELHGILAELDDQAKKIVNLFVEERVPLSAETFSNIVVRNLLEKSTFSSKIKKGKHTVKTNRKRIDPKLRSAARLFLQNNTEFRRLTKIARKIKSTQMERGKYGTLYF